MFVTRHQLAQSREHALINLLDISTTYLNASQRMSDLMAETSRQRLDKLSQAEFSSPTEAGKIFWPDQAQTTQFINEIYEIASDTHKAMIESTEAQIRVFDEIVFASIERAKNFSPWETEIAFGAMRSTLENAEQGLHDISTAAIQTVELADQEIHQVSAELAEKSGNGTSNKKTRIKTE